MATKDFELEDIGIVYVTKSKRSKHLRLTIKHDGRIHVSAPLWLPYKTALSYVVSRREWIDQQNIAPPVFVDDTRIGKAHRLIFKASPIKRCRSSVNGNIVTISHPENLSIKSSEVQAAAARASICVLTKESQSLLPKRLDDLADQYTLTYNSVSIKTLRSRWGSCTNRKDITFSCFLIQLSWQEIDYVITHELCHTKYMSHSRDFWDMVFRLMPQARTIKKEMKQRRPQVVV